MPICNKNARKKPIKSQNVVGVNDEMGLLSENETDLIEMRDDYLVKTRFIYDVFFSVWGHQL